MKDKGCVVCGAPVKGVQAKFCSVVCAGVARRKPRTKFSCEKCGESFGLLNSQVRNRQSHGGRPRFCSRACSLLRFRTNPRPCEWCGKKQHFRGSSQRFCSRSCVVQGTSGSRINSPREHRCLYCSRPYMIPLHLVAHGRRFCSRSCRTRWLRDEGLIPFDPRVTGESRGKVSLVCAWCNEQFLRSRSMVESIAKRNLEHTFCSQECFGAFRRGKPQKQDHSRRYY